MPGINFLVGGIPRGGTTAFADALNQHPDIFCYASETHLLPLVVQAAAFSSPSSAGLPALRAHLIKVLKQALIEMVDDNLRQGSPRPLFRFTATEIERLADEVVGHISRGAVGANLIALVSRSLGSLLKIRSKKKIIGEKTPNNIPALDMLGQGSIVPTFAVVRNPYSVIRSMRKRARDENDKFASEFRGGVANQAGLYVKHSLAAARMAEIDAHLYRFEDVSEHPEKAFTKVAAQIGLSVTAAQVKDMARTIRKQDSRCPRSSFSLDKQALIDAITEGAMQRLGYTAFAGSRAVEANLAPGWKIIAGGYDDGWISRNAILLLVTEPDQVQAEIHFWYAFPGTTADAFDTLRWTISDVNGHVLSEIEAMGGGPNKIVARIDLTSGKRVVCRNGNSVRVLEVRCSHSFLPLAHPSRAGKANGDSRELSCRLVNVIFE